jgi:hypothetical protein
MLRIMPSAIQLAARGETPFASGGDLRPRICWRPTQRVGFASQRSLATRTHDACKTDGREYRGHGHRFLHVLAGPPPGWTGERGFIAPEIFKRHLPPPYADHEYFICGLDVMMGTIEAALGQTKVPIEMPFRAL